METRPNIEGMLGLLGSLYSLEKLIEWKLAFCKRLANSFSALYSLEKLIEWKQILNSD